MRKSTKRIIALAATTAILLAGGGVAFAYWTAGGSGTGSGATGTSSPITVTQTSVVTNLRPGATAQALSGTFTNANDEPVYVSSVTAAISSISGGGPSCDAADYTLANAVMTVNASIAIGAGVGTWSGATIAFANDPLVNQDDCKNATVNFSYTAL